METNKLKLIATDDFYTYAKGCEDELIVEYNEVARCNGWSEATSIEDENLREHFDDQMNNDFEYFTDEYGDSMVVIIAELGLWDKPYHGPHHGAAHGKLNSFMNKMTEDYNYIYYNSENGTFEINAVHHDGTNHFYIYRLSKEGKEYVNEHRYTLNYQDLAELVKNEKMISRFEY